MPQLPSLSREVLLAMHAAGQETAECYRVLAKAERKLMGEVLRGEGEFIELNHFPDEDVFDRDAQSQYYYHAHRGLDGEHGHLWHSAPRSIRAPMCLKTGRLTSPVGSSFRLTIKSARWTLPWPGLNFPL